MNMNCIKHLKNEKGNVTYLTIGLIMIIALMLAFIVNFGKIFATNEQAGTAAEQASLAATSIIYEEMLDVIGDYEREEDDEDEDEELEEFVEERKDELMDAEDYSENEAEIQAINQILEEEIPEDQDLQEEIEEALVDASQQISNEVSEIITRNNGSLDETTITMFNEENRIEVTTAVTYDQVAFGGMIDEGSEEIHQRGIGLDISFVEVLSWNNRSL
ncbi:Tad domain-containing protein [Salicibibacter cibi]|uniref:Tad domain-containing protein n=1 Tax=Salicibibacter cibi TaxID=2743001 RepID=A0A7T7CGR2_9BACI|nr:Tad domain-containing protein [Salicibibacter cibi]QQK81394.1 Tad domain-containing protein [Salicibibacter cibi]